MAKSAFYVLVEGEIVLVLVCPFDKIFIVGGFTLDILGEKLLGVHVVLGLVAA